MAIERIISGLNEQQKKAVESPLGHCLVLAGAGSGKTRVLVSRIAWLISKEQLSPHSILAVTFTNKAAGEIKARLNDMLAMPMFGLWTGTFHGLCHRLLRRHYKEARLPEHFQILDSDDQLRMLKRVILALNLDPEQWPVRQAQSFINGKKDEGLRPAQVHVMSYGPGKTLLRIYQAYEQACQTAGVIDFAEIILRAHEMLRDNEELLQHYQQRFQAILVDEFQDTNTIQYAWIRLLAGENASVMAVGDDDQSIYGWRGAKVENIQQFCRDFPAVEVISLEQNYRSTSVILEAANALIDHNQSRMGKQLWTEGSQGEKIKLFSAFNELEEARFTAEKISEEMNGGRSADDIAILYRSNAQSRVLEEALLRVGVAYRIHGGLRFFERAEIKDALSYLRLIMNRNDDTAFERVVNFPTRGIGDKTQNELRQYARENEISLWQAAGAMLAEDLFTRRAASSLKAFLDLVHRLETEVMDVELDEQIAKVIQLSGLEMHFANAKGERSETKLENLQELVSAAKEFRYEINEVDEDIEDLPPLMAFLAHASLEAGEMQAEAHEPSVHLMTLHAAKGLEFPVVFLVGMEEGLFPARKSMEEPGRLEEERRLCYVGMTRAMQKLFLSYAEIRRQYGREEYHRPSRFLTELPEHLIDEVRAKAAFRPQSMSPSPVLSQGGASMEYGGLSVGQLVTHKKFGQGMILGFEGQGAHARVQVKFGQHGSKWLVLAYANLESA